MSLFGHHVLCWFSSILSLIRILLRDVSLRRGAFRFKALEVDLHIGIQRNGVLEVSCLVSCQRPLHLFSFLIRIKTTRWRSTIRSCGTRSNCSRDYSARRTYCRSVPMCVFDLPRASGAEKLLAYNLSQALAVRQRACNMDLNWRFLISEMFSTE